MTTADPAAGTDRERPRPGRFALVGAAATVVDVGIAVGLTEAGTGRFLADAIALVAAAYVSLRLHGRVTLHYEPEEPLFRVHFVRFYALWAHNQDRLHPQDVNDPRIDPYGTPGWTTYNLDIGGQINPESQWWAGVYNLTDTQYRLHSSGFDAPGVRAAIGVKIKI